MAMPKKAKITSAVLLLAVAAGCVIYLNRPESSASTQSTDDAYVQADFTLVAPQVSGVIGKVLVEENQPVKAGDLLAAIDDRDFIVAVDAAKAQVAAAEASVAGLAARVAQQETAIRQALTETGLTAGELGDINLHGTATPLNDAMESTVLQRLGAGGVPASSSKSITGHTLGAAGAIEAGLCWLLLSDYNSDNDLVPQVRDNAADPALPALNFVQPGQRQVVTSCLSNSFAFGGNNAAIVLTK